MKIYLISPLLVIITPCLSAQTSVDTAESTARSCNSFFPKPVLVYPENSKEIGARCVFFPRRVSSDPKTGEQTILVRMVVHNHRSTSLSIGGSFYAAGGAWGMTEKHLVCFSGQIVVPADGEAEIAGEIAVPWKTNPCLEFRPHGRWE